MRSKFKWIFTLLMALTMQFSFAQEKTITGVVSDASGPLPGVNVIVKGTQRGVSTGFDGSYSIKAKEGETLVYSFMGMRDVLKVVGASSVINTVLQDDSKQLGEVVVVAQSRSKQAKTLGYNVATLKSETLEGKPQADVVRSMQGKVSGLQITNTGGMAGSTSNIVIRGNKSLTGSAQPLFIIDGVPFDVSAGDITGSFNQGANASSSRFLDIDPNNIESMTVLKGLAASVTYGTQGKNGVILITTKKGKKGSEKVSVTYNSQLFLSQVANLPEYTNKYGGGNGNTIGTGTVGNWGAAFDPNITIPHIYDQASITPFFPEYAGARTPWVGVKNNVKDFFRTGVSNSHNLGVTGGGENTQYSFNASYVNENGMVEFNKLNRYNVGLGLTTKLGKKMTLGTNITYINTNYETPPVSAANGAGTESIFKRLLYIPRNLDIHNLPYQNPVTGASIFYRTDLTNPLWLLHNSRSKQDVDRIFGKVELSYKFNDKINALYRIGLDKYVDNQTVYSNKGAVENIYRDGYMRTTSGTNSIINQDLIFEFGSYNLTEKLKFNANLGFNSRRDTYDQSGISSQNQVIFGGLDHSYFANQSTNDPFAGDLNVNGLFTNVLGVYGGVDLSFSDYLFLNLQGRSDFSSAVETRNQHIFYPSASLSFIPTEAIEGLKGNVLDYLKLRAAYGTSAGFPGRYQTRQFAFFNSAINVNTSGAFIPGQSIGDNLGNPNLKPEVHKEFEVGFDLEAFKKRFTLGASAYKRISENQIIGRDVDPSTGGSGLTINAGRIDNKGVEADLTIIPLKTDNFEWNLSTIFYKNVSEVVELPEGQDRVTIAGFSNGIGNYAIEGQPYGVLVGTYAVKDSNGNLLINPTNGKIIYSDDLGLRNDIIGDPNPDYTLTFVNGFRYKGWNLSGQLEFTKGGDFYSNTIENLLRRGVTKDTEDRDGTYVIPGFYGDPITGQPLVDGSGNQIPNTIQSSLNEIYFLNTVDADSQNIYDATRLRLREVSLSYNLPSKFLNGTGINSLTFGIVGQNLWLKTFNLPKYTNVDPELTSTGTGNGLGLDFQTAPQSRRFGFNVKVNF